ncbi:hypothetical protein ACFV1C_13635 [Streptomyces sp. NPDC059605]|uniref:hypothetical protein n=1 Tax=unclassified Streptomyces TaxID=2593676 RepID=UPI00339F8E13
MAENTKPAGDENETPEVEAHSVLDLQETAATIEPGTGTGSCVSVVSVVMSDQ